MPAKGGERDTRRTRASQERWTEIIDAAAHIFHQKGYEATGIQDVADAVGMLKGSLYYYIESKEDLLYAVIDAVHRGAMAILDEVEEADGDPLTKIQNLIEGQIRFEAENHQRIAVFYSNFRSLTGERAKGILDQRKTYERFLQRLVAEGQSQGLIRPELDPHLAAMGMFGMMNWIYQWYDPEGSYTPEDLAREYSRILLAGLRRSPGGTRGASGRHQKREKSDSGRESTRTRPRTRRT